MATDGLQLELHEVGQVEQLDVLVKGQLHPAGLHKQFLEVRTKLTQIAELSIR